MTQIQGSVIVITGASSGIGRATAFLLARKGATLVLAARREDALEDVAIKCRRMGARALAVPTDTTDAGQVETLARVAVEQFGRVDAWINNAAVLLLARFVDAPYEDLRRVLDTNILGYVHGARSALSYFRDQGHGVLVNVGSVASRIPMPYASAYVMSKHAVRALGSSLRQELQLEGQRHIHVCTVMPGTIDTPIFDHAANYTGRAGEAMPPVYSPFRVAAVIARVLVSPRREVAVGRTARWLPVEHALAPATSERLIARQVDRKHLSTTEPARGASGNLFVPSEPARIDGGWLATRRARQRSALAWTLGLGLPVLAGFALAARARPAGARRISPRDTQLDVQRPTRSNDDGSSGEVQYTRRAQ